MRQSWIAALLLLHINACGEAQSTIDQRAILADDLPTVSEIVRRDRERGLRAIATAGERMARGFTISAPERRASQMQRVLRRIRHPRHGIDELVTLPISFLVTVGMDGRVVARARELNTMIGTDLASHASVVQRALAGQTGMALSPIPALQEDAPPVWTLVFAAPCRWEGELVGAVSAGIPLWMLARQFSRQLRLDNASDAQVIVWGTLFRNDATFSESNFPPDLRETLPSVADRSARLEESPGGYTHAFNLYGRAYAMGVLPLPTIGDDVGAIVLRSGAP